MTTLPTDQYNQTLQLPDGRTLGFAEYGDAAGKPVFLFHGQPGNRLFHPPDETTRSAKIRLIVPDRPGYGLSTFQPNRKITDWADDLQHLANHLSSDRFAVIGFSAGGPYALACAARIPERIHSIILISSAPPLTDPQVLREMSVIVKANRILFRNLPWLALPYFRFFWAVSRNHPYKFIEMAKTQSPAADQKALEDPNLFSMMLHTWQENLRIDPRGYVEDAILLMGDWGFDLEAVSHQVQLIWGTDDRNIPLSIVKYFEDHLLRSTRHVLPDQGHFGMLREWEQILTWTFPDS